MEFKGELETHLTVDLNASGEIEELRKLSAECGWKFLHIELLRGAAISQPMLSRRRTGSLATEKAAAERLKKFLTECGFLIVRVKIEVTPPNEDVPQNAREAEHFSERYFENHLKILLDGQTNKFLLAAIAGKHSAHLSRNALRRRADGVEEFFVTQRSRGVYAESRLLLEMLLKEVRNNDFEVIEIEEEYVVYDSNLQLDDGWIETEK